MDWIERESKTLMLSKRIPLNKAAALWVTNSPDVALFIAQMFSYEDDMPQGCDCEGLAAHTAFQLEDRREWPLIADDTKAEAIELFPSAVSIKMILDSSADCSECAPDRIGDVEQTVRLETLQELVEISGERPAFLFPPDKGKDTANIQPAVPNNIAPEVAERLQALCDAAVRFFPDGEDGGDKNEIIAHWIQQQCDLSTTAANSAASIIRPNAAKDKTWKNNTSKKR